MFHGCGHDVIPGCAWHLVTQMTGVDLRMTDQWSKHVACVITLSNKEVVLKYIVDRADTGTGQTLFYYVLYIPRISYSYAGIRIPVPGMIFKTIPFCIKVVILHRAS